MKKIFALLLALMLVSSFALAQEGLTAFETQDISDPANPVTVTQEIFAPYDITMVNIWATWCGYCVDEMPALAELKEKLPENVNLISICDDAADNPELVNQILTTTGATNFATLLPTDDMYQQLLGQVYSFPTTFYLDSKGEAIGYIAGVPSLDDPVGAYLEIIDKAFELLEAQV